MSSFLYDAGGLAVVMIRAVVLGALVAIAGAAAFRTLVLPRLDVRNRGAIPVLERLAARIGLWACVLLLVADVPRLALQARAFIDARDALWPMIGNVLGTRWGYAWCLQVAAVLAAATGFVLAGRRRETGWQLALAAAFVALSCGAFMGHPSAAPQLAWLNVLFDVVHLSSVSVWIGSLVVILMVSLSPDLASEGGGALAALVNAFHPVALRAAPTVVFTGVVNGKFRIAHLDALWLSSYGQLLLAKVALVLIVLSFGALNSQMAARRAAGGRVGSARAGIAMEMVFATVTVLVTAILVATEPPG